MISLQGKERAVPLYYSSVSLMSNFFLPMRSVSELKKLPYFHYKIENIHRQFFTSDAEELNIMCHSEKPR
jgi:hypothetical protein